MPLASFQSASLNRTFLISKIYSFSAVCSSESLVSFSPVAITWQFYCAKKVVSDSQGLVDFAVGLAEQASSAH